MDTCFGLIWRAGDGDAGVDATPLSLSETPAYDVLENLEIMIRAKKLQLVTYRQNEVNHRKMMAIYLGAGKESEARSELILANVDKERHKSHHELYTNMVRTKGVITDALALKPIVELMKTTSVTLGMLLQKSESAAVTWQTLQTQMSVVEQEEQVLMQPLGGARMVEEVESAASADSIELPSVPVALKKEAPKRQQKQLVPG